MRSNKAKNTKPEVLFRKALWNSGLRGYRLHWQKAPGRPDIAFQVEDCRICKWLLLASMPKCDLSLPKNNRDFWKRKFERNERDKEKTAVLKSNGWKVLVIWECELKSDRNLKLTRSMTNGAMKYSAKILVAWAEAIGGNAKIRDWLIENG